MAPEGANVVHDEGVRVQKYPGVNLGQHLVQEEPGGGADPEHVQQGLQPCRVPHCHLVQTEPAVSVPLHHWLQYALVDVEAVGDDVDLQSGGRQEVQSPEQNLHLLHLSPLLLALLRAQHDNYINLGGLNKANERVIWPS